MLAGINLPLFRRYNEILVSGRMSMRNLMGLFGPELEALLEGVEPGSIQKNTKSDTFLEDYTWANMGDFSRALIKLGVNQVFIDKNTFEETL